MTHSHLLLAIDQFESGDAAVDFAIGMASGPGARLTVLHVREVSANIRVLPLESIGEAQAVAEGSKRRIHLAGIPVDGLVCNGREGAVARHIVETAEERWCTGIVLGSRRLKGIGRLRGGGVRERVMRLSSLPVIVAPPALTCRRPKWADALARR